MAEFTIAGIEYRSARLNARQQWNVVRRLAPLLAAAGDLLKLAETPAQGGETDAFAAFAPFAEALSVLTDEQSNYILDTCLKAASRKASEQWRPVMQGDVCMWEDIDMPAMLQITWQVMQESLSSFLGGLPGITRAALGAPPQS